MKTEFQNIPLKNDDQKKRFEIEVNGHYAFINYGEMKNSTALVHTEAEPQLQGTGAAEAVVEKTLQYLRERNQTILPYCPYIMNFIRKNPEWKALVDQHFIGYSEL